MNKPGYDWNEAAARFEAMQAIEHGLTKPDGSRYDGLDTTHVKVVVPPDDIGTTLGALSLVALRWLNLVIAWHWRGGGAGAVGVQFGGAEFGWSRDAEGRESVNWLWSFATTPDAGEALAHKLLYGVGISPART